MAGREGSPESTDHRPHTGETGQWPNYPCEPHSHEGGWNPEANM